MTKEKVTLTEKENMVLRAIISSGSNFNGDRLDLAKSWEEQELESSHAFHAFADCRDYGCGLDNQACRGIFGSLVKKDLIKICFDEVYWLLIGKKEFDRIKNAIN